MLLPLSYFTNKSNQLSILDPNSKFMKVKNSHSLVAFTNSISHFQDLYKDLEYPFNLLN